jgi:hypothetical protein
VRCGICSTTDGVASKYDCEQSGYVSAKVCQTWSITAKFSLLLFIMTLLHCIQSIIAKLGNF